MPADAVTPLRPPQAVPLPVPEFAIWSGESPEPGRFGISQYPSILLEILEHLPNLERFRERRMRDHGPVPVRFQI
ncbi:MAG: hypothetical protein A3K19_08735 [Lentisphaerae bacterium RIFOXYB12_FULL_65_16]|nr:MAG: hypothetical protein A3K18_02660 [Lentisphaerae bacterium RIFOXYA12_64_32]OGV86018.1 MAG: hypothetical protein A3K19_08735 [Lentisphaerae bacterium RIFOXYB12_FULL_65_16]